jgi:hypothetical protein
MLARADAAGRPPRKAAILIPGLRVWTKLLAEQAALEARPPAVS